MFNSSPRYDVIILNSDLIALVDIGPWDKHPTITNRAEVVVHDLVKHGLKEQRLAYVDSEGEITELVHEEGRLLGFRYVHPTDPIRIRIQEARDRGSLDTSRRGL